MKMTITRYNFLTTRIALICLCLSSGSDAFVTPSTNSQVFHPKSHQSSPRQVLSAVPDLASLWIAADSPDSWRQYVPLVVSLGVITDILLGSPLANKALSAARTPETTEDDVQLDEQGKIVQSNLSPLELLQRAAAGDKVLGGAVLKDPKERVDTAAMAQAALDKASATTELRQFLEDSKSDWQKMKDVQSQLDKNMAAFDNRSQQAQSKIQEEQSNLDG